MGRDRLSCLFFNFHRTAVIVSSALCALCFTAIRKRANSFNVKQCRLRITKGLFLCSGASCLVLFLIKNFITAFWLKDLDLFLFSVFSPPSPTNYLCFLIAPLLTHCRKLMLLLSIIQHVSSWQQGGQRTASNMLILLGAGRVCTLTC